MTGCHGANGERLLWYQWDVLMIAASAVATEEVLSLGSLEWWSEFLRSPGFGGVAALLAALVVLWRARTDRKIAKEDREATAAVSKADRDAAASLAREERAAVEQRAADDRRAEADAARQLREQQLEDSAAVHWWDMYRWTLDNIDQLDPDRAATLLEALDAQAPGEAERTLVSVAGDLLIASAQEEGGDDDGSGTTGNDQGRASAPSAPGPL